MKHRASIVAATLVAGAIAGPGAAAAKTPTSHKKPAATWQAVAGLFKTKPAAEALVTKLGEMGLGGYVVETEKRGQFSHGKKYEVEKAFITQKEAKAEVAKLHKKHIRGASVENERSEKGAG